MTLDSHSYDVIIIGGASAGFAAAIFSARRKLRTLLITKNLGGQLTLTDSIENYPGVLKASGAELVQIMALQAKTFGAEMLIDEVVETSRTAGSFAVHTRSGHFTASALILAFGKTPRDLHVPGEDRLKGRGVHYCAVCDMGRYKGKTVVVTGGGNSAIEAGLYAARLCKKVYLVRRSTLFGGEQLLIKQLEESPNVQFINGAEVVEVKGTDRVESVIIRDLQESHRQEILCEALFVEIGFEIKPQFIKELVTLNEKNEIVIDRNNRTSTPFVYAAGDATDLYYKQSVISAGEGAKAALAAYDDLMRTQGKMGIKGDWIKLKKKG